MTDSANSTTGTAQIGVTGLAVMGSNLARNFAHHGYTVALHNRTTAKTDALLAEHGSEGTFVRSETIEEFLDALEKPRRVIIMVKAGDPTDAVINELADAMEEGDIIIAPQTDPAWTPLFVFAGGVVVNVGSTITHSSIVCRELGIPCAFSFARSASITAARRCRTEMLETTATIESARMMSPNPKKGSD